MENPGKEIRCFACGASVPDVEGPVHRYLDSAPGCWERYGRILAREYGEFYDPDVHSITVHTYAVQHPGRPEQRTLRSLNGHLISLYLVLEKGLPGAQATRCIKRAVEDQSIAGQFQWLDPPSFEGALNLTHVLKAKNRAEHGNLVREWASSVWQRWKERHFQAIKSLAQQVSREG